MIIVMIEHVIIAFKYGLTLIINDKPTWVIDDEKQQQNKSKDINVKLDLKKEEFKSRGETPLEEVIAAVKLKNKKKAQANLLNSSLGDMDENVSRLELLQRQKQML